MAKPKVFIRVDAGQEIGFGHIVRCLALAHMIKNLFEIQFYSSNMPKGISRDIVKQGFQISLIREESFFLSILTGAEIVILDNYKLGTEYQKSIKDKNCNLVCIDDLHDQEFHADLIINHAPGISTNDYSAKEYTHFALGLDFALLRPAFLKAALKKVNNSSNSLMICFGGSDYLNLTKSVFNIVLRNNSFSHINVVIGEGYKEIESLKKLINKSDKVTLFRALNEEKILEVMQASEYAIVPSSGILIECIAVGLKVISGMYVENQKLIYTKFNNSGAFIDAGNFSENEVKIALSKLDNFERSYNLEIDGNSGKRINKEFKFLK